MKITLGKKIISYDTQKIELKEFRSMNSRIFSNGENNTIMEFYDKDIFYKDNNQYQEIDNRLLDKKDFYQNKANSFQTRFFKHIENGKIFEINNNKCSLSLALKNCKCGLDNCICQENDNNEGIIKFKDIKEHTDLEYINQSDRIKENIIINNKLDKYEYEFEILIDGLYPTPSKDGKRLELRRKENGQVQFFIPAPFMVDNKGIRSESVYYEILESQENKLSLKVVADSSWINDDNRSFPVIIDPQIVIEKYYGSNIYDDVYDINGRETIFSYKTYLYDKLTDINALWLYHDSNEEYSSDLIINLNYIPQKILDNLKSAKLIVYIDKYSEIDTFEVDGIIFSQPIENNCITLDLNDHFSNDKNEIVIKFNHYSRYAITSKNIMFNSPTLILEANVDYYGNEDNIVPISKSINSNNKIENIIFLKEGNIASLFSSFNEPLQITHIYNKKFNKTSFGQGWNLNLSKTLKVATEDTNENTKYVYTDEYGNDYLFLEKYYYLKDNQKHFINKNLINITQDGKLLYNNLPVYKQQFCNGFTLITKIDDFIDADLIEQRQDELAKLEDYINQYKLVLINYVCADKTTGEIYKELNSLTKNEYKSLIKYVSSNYILISKSEAYQLQAQYLNLKELNNQINDSEIEESKKDDLKIQLSLIKNQIELSISQAQNNFENIKQIFKNYFAKEDQLLLIRKQIPINYIKDDNGNINGFNEYGNLILLSDSYGNYISINYDNNNNISEINDNKNCLLKFKYDNNLLQSITDNNGRIVKYKYDNDLLIGVFFQDESTLSFKYINNQIKNIINSDYQSTNYEYDEINRIINIKTSSNCNYLNKDMSSLNDDYIYLLSEYNFNYSSTSTSIIDNENNKEIYSFIGEKLSSLKTIDNLSNTYSTTYTYITLSNGNKQIKEISKKNNDDNEIKITEYNDINKIIKEIYDWKKISSSIEERTTKNYKYNDDNLLIEVESNYEQKQNNNITSFIAYIKYLYNNQGSITLIENYILNDSHGRNYESFDYDDNGNIIKHKKWNSLDSSSKFYDESIYNENGQITSKKNETNEIIEEYEYLNNTNFINSINYSNGNKFAYSRNPFNYLINSITQSTKNGLSSTNNIVYKNDLVVEANTDNTSIDYSYDYKGRKTNITVNNVTQRNISYEDYKNNGTTILYNKQTEKLIDNTIIESNKIKQNNEIIETLKINNSTILQNKYDLDGKLITSIDSINGSTHFTYDEFKNIINIKNNSISLLENYKYDSNNNLIEQSINNQKYNFFYKNDFNKTLDYISFDSFKFYPLFDANNRYIGKEIYNNTNLILKEFITYYKVGDHSTSLPQCISFNNKDNLQYKYNSNGFITEINHNGHLYSKYSYDGNNLIREDNKILNKTIIFTYDNNGNILSRHEYPFSNDDLSSYECNHFNYVYDKDKLLSYNNEICKYNSLGNPIIYRNKDVLWKYGKYLIKYGDLSFTYDGNGRRISKGNITYSYDSNGRLIKQSNGLEFIYDSTGLIGFKYNNNTYFYQKDIQSNITSIIDSNGEIKVQYKYDAWGNHAILDNNGNDINDGIGLLNPFRYRSYYYDDETGLYFLQSRYYDPEVGRFISQDSLEFADHNSIIGLNLYAYCSNNPVNLVDPNGQLPQWAMWLIGSIIILGLGVATVFTGGAAGVILGAAFYGATTSAISGAIIGGIIGGITDGWEGVLDGASSGFMWGAISGAIAGALTSGINIATGSVKIIGSAQKTGNIFHRFSSNVQAGKFAMQIGRYSKIGLNSKLKTVGLNGGSRPDVVAIARIGNNKFIEVVSKTQTIISQENKIKMMISINPKTTGKVISWVLQHWFYF